MNIPLYSVYTLHCIYWQSWRTVNSSSWWIVDESGLYRYKLELRVLIVTPAVYPHLVVNYDFSYFLLKLESQNQVYNIPVVLPSSAVKVLDNLVQGFLGYDRK